jgi:ribonuclease T2
MENGMKKFVLAVAALSCCCGSALASEKASGTFKVEKECDAYLSFKNKTEPVKVHPGESYDVTEVNKAGSWDQVRISINNNLRWISKQCGTAELGDVVKEKPQPGTGAEGTTPSGRVSDEYLLSVSWQPAFCEAHSSKKECKSETETSYEASHFALHGLWPQPNGRFYCGVSFEEKNKAESKNWCGLSELKIDDSLRSRLAQQMPGAQSCLDRYEWTKHGSCYNGKPQQAYFEDSVSLMDQLNASEAQKLFAANVGKKLTAAQIRAAFDQSFGAGAGEKVKISCKQDGSRNLIVELQIPLKGDLSGGHLADALKAAKGRGTGCKEGIVDPAGLQ